ncbi:hypothetical protein IL306_010177 [Fusarium sp. DS 682]|nr:hypothetical protein IL306_010177 [Fusarium sp. DS 682]
MDQKRNFWSGNMVWYAKILTQTIIKVNDAFLGTQMLTQANFINVVSNLHLDPVQQVFPLCMSTMGTPFERVVKLEKSNSDLILVGPDGEHPVNDIADADWLMGNLTNMQHFVFRKMINRASPVLPYQKVDETWQSPDVLELPKRKESLIMHMRCASHTEAASEGASFFLDSNRSGTFHPLLYMKFDAHNARFNDCESMLRTFLVRLSCNRLQTGAFVTRLLNTFMRLEGVDRDSLFDEFESVQKANDDHDLCELIIEWLSSDTKQPTRIQGLLSKPMTPALVFAEILEEMAEDCRSWAKILLSWLLACFRPLRNDELCRVSDTVWRQVRGSKATRPALADILHSFHGIIVSINGETRFRHSDTRAWLESRCLSGGEEKWYDTTDTGRHNDVLHTCIKYFQDAAGNTEPSVQLIPYTIEFWPKHWRLVKESEKQMLDLFENESVFRFWANALRAMPDSRLKPHPKHRSPLPVAAHLGLTAVVEALLKRDPRQAELRGPALIEACRAGHAAIIKLLMRSYLNDLDFGDKTLHEASRAVSLTRNGEALRELVNALPEPPNLSSTHVSRTQEFGESSKVKESQQTNDPPEISSPRTQEAEHDEDGVSPFQWLMRPMYEAARSGMDDVVARLLELGVPPNPPMGSTPSSNSFLCTAVVNSNLSCAKLLINAGASLTAKNEYGDTALNGAIRWASSEAVEFLLEHGARIDEKDSEGRTVLNMAAGWGSFAALKVILSHKEDIGHLMHDSDKGPVNQAVEIENKKCLKLLLNHGFSANTVTSAGETPLMKAIQNERIDLCKMLLDSDADPDLAPENVKTPLIQAISKGNLDIVKLLIEYKANIDKREPPPDHVHAAADWGEPEIFQYLLENGADPNARDSDDIPVIGAAASGGHTNMVRWLAEANADVNVTYLSNKTTPLHEAVPYPDMVSVLLQHGADISQVTVDSETALDLAISANNLKTVQIMLEEPEIKPDLGSARTQEELRAAVIKGYTEVVEALLEGGVDVNTVNEDNESLLAYAVKNNAASDMVRKILEYNPDLELRDKKQNTALHWIQSSVTLETVRLIVNAGGRLDSQNFHKKTPLIYAIRAKLDNVFSYMLKKKPTLLTRDLALSDEVITPLHEACIGGSLAMVRTMIEHQMDVNSSCEGVYGTPLIAATLRSDALFSDLASEIIVLLLVNGASPGVPGGLFQYPLISACLSCPVSIIQLLLNSDASPHVKDSLNRKPVHLASYNSLEVLQLLEIPDSDFAAPDIVGRVPLHYAVMTGDVDLVRTVLERSVRVGVDVNVKDDDGWTPLLWAARASRIWNRQLGTQIPATDVVSFLLENGADPKARGQGFDREWTVHEVAYYHNTDL